MPEIIHLTEFPSNSPLAHGGMRRSEQIREILESTGHKIRQIEIERKADRSALYRVLRGFQASLRYRIPAGPNLTGYGSLGNYVDFFQNILKTIPAQSVIVWEQTRLMSLARMMGTHHLPLIATPQNLESQVPGQPDLFLRTGLPRSRVVEWNNLRRAQAVFCISDEETRLLTADGISANSLLYHPASNWKQELLRVRERRSQCPAQPLLILGTCHNPPSHHGMQKLIQFISRTENAISDPVIIAGYGTEKLAHQSLPQNISMMGSVSNDQLMALLSQAKALLVYQEAAAGAMTKIPEALVAGIPVIANPIAARSTEHLEGIIRFNTLDQLPQILKMPTFPIPPIPQKNNRQEKTFLNAIGSKPS